MKNIVKNDMFNIANRLKKIDKTLFIIFNKKMHRYEVHSTNFKPNTLAFCLKGHLNAFALKKAYLANSKNACKTLKNIVRTNEKLQQKSMQEITQKNIEILNSYLEFANQKNCDVTF